MKKESWKISSKIPKAKNLLKFKIGCLKYEVKDAYTKTVILSSWPRKLEFNIINSIIKFAGICDSSIDLKNIIPTSSKGIQSQKEPRDLSHDAETSNLTIPMNSSYNIL